jgi:hypothetical protein
MMLVRFVVVPTLLVTGMTACAGSGDSDTTTVTQTISETTTSVSATAAPAPAPASTDTVIPTPANSQRSDGSESIQERGTHQHFLVNGSPIEVMDAYKTVLEDAGWTVVVENAGGGGGGGGATYTGTKGDVYGVFVGGGYGSTTDVDSCVWPTKPSNTNCGNNN